MLPADPAPVLYAVRMGDESVPYDFVHTFFALADDKYLPPVRQWAEGSINRQFAVLLTNHLILMGYAEPAKGNQAATWINRQRAMRWLGLDDSALRQYGITTIGMLQPREVQNQ